MPTTSARRRTVFDLSPQELQVLYRHNQNVSATVPPHKPRRSTDTTYADHAFDAGIYERYRDLHARAKRERSEWLKTHRISHKVAAQAALTHYNPYTHAARIGCVAPPIPPGYADALAAWHKPAPKDQQKARVNVFTLPGGITGFSF